MAWGPVLYAVDDVRRPDGSHEVGLRAVPAFDEPPKTQKRFATSSAPPEEETFGFYPRGGTIVPARPKAGEPREFEIEATGSFERILPDQTRLRVRRAAGLEAVPLESVLLLTQTSPREIRVVVRDEAPSAEYELDLRVLRGGEERAGQLFRFLVKP